MGSCVEVPIYVDEGGIHPLRIGNLHIQCAALNQSNINVQILCTEAALSGDPELVMQAMAMDPLSGAVCTLKEIRDLTREMLEAEKQWIPQFDGRSLRPTPTISIPADVKRVDVPIDPARAIAHRFSALANREI